MLLRDGTIYFIALLAMSIAEVLVKTVPAFQNLASVGTVILALQPILISRFLLNLRQAGKPREDTHSAFNSQFSVPGFRVPTLDSIIGNMGEELDHRPEEEIHDVTGDLDDGVLIKEQAGGSN
ncbi:hypothetical protein EW026_g6695 [Hermanssonia centrifuga]|uniref:Uncharacterized protein n=1 Tax=Hermanssonia centrifuga TaxID=98765 RepID=A0A4S4KA84_9APHY|nr:hypothetical protein EW026_g6695 [Hermanssonia centrifuga]